MSGHSRWATIKRKKGAADSKRGKIFTKLIKEITIAARIGGGDINGNPRLRTAIDKAKAASMPKDNIDRGIKKGTGELEGVNYEELMYEAYGPGGCAILIEIMTDNKNRTVGEIRHILSRNNGRLGESGCVSWNFDKKGIIIIDKKLIDEDKLIEIALEGGAEDVKTDSDNEYEIVTAPADFYEIQKILTDKNLKIESAEIQMIPRDTTKNEGKEAEQIMRLIELLEDHDDVQNIFTNFEPPADMME